MSANLDVVTFGEAMLLLIAAEPGPLAAVQTFHKGTAGAETNVATGLARLGFHVGWASRLGTDSMGAYLLETMQREGIDCSHVTLDPIQRTGMMFKGKTEDGSDPLVEYHRKGSAASWMTPYDLDEKWLSRARHLHVTGIFPALSPGCLELTRRAIRVMRDAGGSVSFDPNLRPALWQSQDVMRATLNELAASCDTVLPGVAEGLALAGTCEPAAIARFFRQRGAARVIVKLGPDGAYFDDEVAGTGIVPVHPVSRVVDTVGAGDGFAVGVISALLEGRGVVEAVRRGAWIGACAVQVSGDTEGLPNRRELEAACL
ncbi:sugar kinase [Burkholderia multivorans]|uniref:sugar kinase n=1 Tax=Burkholderia multivorans TaxID=87883 RepID=UPI0019D2A6DF|nr:sugar kinase [Burkholderia multivorans]MBN7129777.1 sugar kinase [Burkholderia multivorans]QSL25743.1 sugar kinase [Burkholderia multivorans]